MQDAPRLPLTHWRTRDGRVVAIREMSDDHLRNTIKMLKRKVVGWGGANWQSSPLAQRLTNMIDEQIRREEKGIKVTAPKPGRRRIRLVD